MRSTSCSTEKTRVRVAASSSASGRPSRGHRGPRRRTFARARHPVPRSERGTTRPRRLPRAPTPRTAALSGAGAARGLVTSIRTVGQVPMRPATSSGLGKRCSALSTSTASPPSASPRLSSSDGPAAREPRVRGRSREGRARGRGGASGTQNTPSGNPSSHPPPPAKRTASCPYRLGPVSVSKRTSSGSSSRTSPSSLLPAQKRRGRHRQVRSVQRLEEGKSPSPTWNTRSAAARSLNRCSPRSTSPFVPTSAAVDADTTTCPPCAAAAIRAARCTSNPT